MHSFVLAAAFAGALIAQSASARSLEVRTGDLDLGTAQGRAALDQRIGRAARAVCEVNGLRPLSEVMETRRCVQFAIDQTRPRLAAIEARRMRAAG